MFPNPARESIQLTILGTQVGELVIEVTDIYGRLVLRNITWKELNMYKTEIYIDQLPEGVYIMKISVGSNPAHFQQFVKS